MSNLLYKVINPIVKGLLRSPLHGLMSKNTMLIEFKGRKSGRMFTTPVSYHIEGDRVHCFTSQEFGWWRNLVDAKKVVLTLKGDRIVGAPTVWVDEPEKITVFDLPEHHRRRLRTTNVLERLNREIKRRTAVATLFPNEASLLRLVTALVAEVSDEWEIGRAYSSWRANRKKSPCRFYRRTVALSGTER